MSTLNDAAPGAPAATLGARTAELCDHLQRSHTGADTELLCDFAVRFFAKAPRALWVERSVETLAAMTEGAFRFLYDSRPEDVNVEVLNPEEEGWDAPVTIVRAEVGDRPFIVDTIREYLSAENLPIQHYIYPVLRVGRDATGRITAIGGPRDEAIEPPDEGEWQGLEALVHCETSRVADPERRAEIAAEIRSRLGDVVHATAEFPAMIQAVDATLERVREYKEWLPERAEEFEEIVSFLRWLRHDNFIFLGYREYRLEGDGTDPMLQVLPETGLGILRNEEESRWAEAVPLSSVPDPLRRRIVAGPTLIISKTNREATVHRRARMDYIGIKELDERGMVVGERRFLGLFTSKAYLEQAESIPILRRKLERVLGASGATPGGHDYKEIITIFNSMPKEEVFQASAIELSQEVQTVLAQLFADEVHVTLRSDPLGRGVSIMVILPRGRFSGEIRQRIQQALTQRLEGTLLNYHLAMGAGDQARLHFYLAAPSEVVERVASQEIEQEVRRLIRSWEDRLAEALAQAYDAGEAQRLARQYGPAFSEEYRAIFSPASAVRDIGVLERMQQQDHGVAVDLRTRVSAPGTERVGLLQLYLRDERLVLSDFMPILENAGVRVVDVNPATVSAPGLPAVSIYGFRVQGSQGEPLPIECAEVLAELLLAVRAGDAPNDGFNALVLRAGLRWREVDVLRTYAHYAFQIGALPTRLAAARALLHYPEVARLLIALFHAKFEPEVQSGRQSSVVGHRSATEDQSASGEAVRATADSRPLTAEAGSPGVGALQQDLSSALESVVGLADDRALRRLWTLVDATVRTNYFRYGGAEPTFRSGGAPYISIKVRDADVEELQRCRLLYEIFVHSANMEGVHLRGAPVSRGGIRWSDRPDDFRTEILGLVQTQIVKNAVIVPGGSKGGFIAKRSFADRERMGQEATEQYRTLIRGMLDLTDNLVGGKVVPPPDVVRYDGDDPYLVVAADKGTAHLSDVANALAADYGFWLGDAFASGGSQGYDHKREGITARGAWECVKRHFREMGKDIQEEPFTVIGIGDMGGDVFGNGMLLSRQIRLIAAFDHRHIFLDPDPDPETSYAERERLFALPRSSWEDYDRSKLSAGGMIVPRGSKGVELTPEVRRALALDDAAERLDGEALIRTVLRAPAELLWNGGIGTYVKDRDETHAEVGDSANDPVRVNADELRCHVVGEGGNLGFTQQARIVFALRGGRINTDALDNSAGVDMSDHEVNLKILLRPAVAEGEMSVEARNELLEEMTGEVTRLVLRNNIGQSLAVSLDEQRSREALGDFAALITAFERERVLERGTQGIPSSDELQERAAEGRGLTRPTLAVLLAHAKLHAKARLLASPLPDDPATAPYLQSYFPPQAVAATGGEALAEHRLRREIVATELVNDLVDLMGAAFLHRVARDSGHGIPEVVRAWLIASRVAGAAEIRADLGRLEGAFPAEVIYRWLFGLSRVLERTTLWALANVAPDAATPLVVEENRAGLARLRGEFADIVKGDDRELFLGRVRELEDFGVDGTLARRLITLRFLSQLLNALRIAQEAKTDPVATGRAYYAVSERFACARLRQALWSAVGDNPWEKRYAQTLVEDVDRAQREITRSVLACQARGQEHCLDALDRIHSREVEAFRALVAELTAEEDAPLSAYAIAVRALGAIASV